MEYITLTRIIRDYMKNEFVAGRILPEIKVPGFPLKVKTWGKGMFLLFATLRAKYANSNIIRIDKSGELLIDAVTHDLVASIDIENEATLDLPEQKARAAKRAQEGVLLKREADLAAVLQDLDTYPSGNKTTLSGTSQWSDLTNSEPVKDVYAAKKAVFDKIGVDPNLIVIPKGVFDEIRFHPKLATFEPQSAQWIPATEETLKARFGVNNIVIAQSKKLNETDSTFVQLWDNTVILLYVNPNPTPDQQDVSFGYCFRENKYPYIDDKDIEPGKVIGIRSNDKRNDCILAPEAGYLFTGVIS